MPPPPDVDDLRERRRRFREAYALHRAREGRGLTQSALLDLPFVKRGPTAPQWAVRARTFRCFVRTVLASTARDVAPRPITLLDLGAGNGWLCYRVAKLGHHAIALDIRADAIDGLGAARGYLSHLASLFPRVVATFEAIPLAPRSVDLAVFNASLHYALDLRAALTEVARVVRPGGRVAVLDSPFYRRPANGEAMVAEKQRTARAHFGDLAPDLTALPFVEYLTPDRLAEASRGLGLTWRRHRVVYPLWYELRPVVSLLRGHRPPSRFDLWEAAVP